MAVAQGKRPHNVVGVHQYGRPDIIFEYGPIQKRNEPCWCGSNKKYKKCHGKV